MAQNYATEYNDNVVERFKLGSKTDTAFSTEYTWEGVKSIALYSVTVPAALNTYDRAANANRFGTPTEVDTTLQTLTLTQDLGLEQIVDFGNLKDSKNAQAAGKHMKRVTDELITPTIDKYRLTALDTAASANSQYVNTGATTTTNAYLDFLATAELLSNNKVPLVGRTAFVTYNYYNLLKRSDYVLASEDFAGNRHTGDYGTVDGITLIPLPATYMPGNDNLIMCHKSSQVGPVKMKTIRVLEGQQGYDGNILQWRLFHDAFVLDQLKLGVAAHKTS